jgi:large subunit ribosomal protein L35Ae
VISVEGRIVGHRLGGNRYYPRQLIIEVEGAGKDISAIIGKKVVWVHPVTGRKFVGKIVRRHGKRNRFIAYFRVPPPGQAKGGSVVIV